MKRKPAKNADEQPCTCTGRVTRRVTKRGSSRAPNRKCTGLVARGSCRADRGVGYSELNEVPGVGTVASGIRSVAWL